MTPLDNLLKRMRECEEKFTHLGTDEEHEYLQLLRETTPKLIRILNVYRTALVDLDYGTSAVALEAKVIADQIAGEDVAR